MADRFATKISIARYFSQTRSTSFAVNFTSGTIFKKYDFQIVIFYKIEDTKGRNRNFYLIYLNSIFYKFFLHKSIEKNLL
jgi:hypothetical protein